MAGKPALRVLREAFVPAVPTEVIMLRPPSRLVLPIIAAAAMTLSGCPKRAADAPSAPVTLAAGRIEQSEIADVQAAKPQAAEVVQLAQVTREDSPGKPEEITFNDLKFEIKPSSRFDEALLTPRIKGLEGKRIRVPGIMLATFQQKGIKEFILLMNTECKYGSAKDPVWCNIRVTMDEDQSATYTTRAVTVEGVLNLDVLEGAKYDISLYTLDEAKVVK
jgi:hypothetical protein